jgi:uncharacterized membrane protein
MGVRLAQQLAAYCAMITMMMIMVVVVVVVVVVVIVNTSGNGKFAKN